MKNIINNEQDTKEYIEKYTTTNPNERLVTISSRTIYHKYATISIAIPNDIKKEDVGEWLFENEGKWIDDMEQANGQAILDFGVRERSKRPPEKQLLVNFFQKNCVSKVDVRPRSPWLFC